MTTKTLKEDLVQPGDVDVDEPSWHQSPKDRQDGTGGEETHSCRAGNKHMRPVRPKLCLPWVQQFLPLVLSQLSAPYYK